MKKYFVTAFLQKSDGSLELWGGAYSIPTRPVSASELTEKFNKIADQLNSDDPLYPYNPWVYKVQTVEDDTPEPEINLETLNTEFENRLKEEHKLRGTIYAEQEQREINRLKREAENRQNRLNRKLNVS